MTALYIFSVGSGAAGAAQSSTCLGVSIILGMPRILLLVIQTFETAREALTP